MTELRRNGSGAQARRGSADRRVPDAGRPGRAGKLEELREARKATRTSIYRRRRIMAACLVVLGVLALVFAVLAQTSASGAAESAVAIDPNNATPYTVLAEAGKVEISTPVRPASLTGLGYHPEGESLVELAPRGENLSVNPLLGLFDGGETPEDIHYYMMDAADRDGPQTGALDVGAGAGTTVYAPVTGTVTAIRPDPKMPSANVIEIKPASDVDVRVVVSLVRSEAGSAGVNTPVTAGMTEIGAVADSSEIMDPQLSSYTNDAGNHVSVTVSTVS